MRKFVFAAATASLGLGVATPVFAQDTYEASSPPPPYVETAAPATNPIFTGPRAGALLGYDALRPGSTEDSDISGDDQSADGLFYGGDIGYDFAMGGGLIGVEAEIAGSTGRVQNDPVDPNDFGYGRVKAGRDLYLGLRGGILANPTTLIYAKAGYTNARLDLTRNDTVTTTGRHYNLDGYRIGAGVEKALGPKTYAKVEYRYSNYGDARLEYPDGTNTDNFSVDTDRHQIVAGVGFRF